MSIEPNSDAWLAERRKHICSSEISSIMGMAPDTWKNANEVAVWIDKTKGTVRETNEIFERGHVLERLVGMKWEEITGDVLKPSTFVVSKKNPLFGATPDGYDKNGNCVQLKTADIGQLDKWEHGVPDHYRLQVQFEMFVTDTKQADIICIFGSYGEMKALQGLRSVAKVDDAELLELYTYLGWDVRRRTLYRDDEMLADAVPFLEEWWDVHVEGEMMPEPDEREREGTLDFRGDKQADMFFINIEKLSKAGKEYKVMQKELEVMLDGAECFLTDSGYVSLKRTKANRKQFKYKVF